jgi:antitoxin ParD1/3/4
MATMNISLPDKMKKWVEKQVKSGRYSNASDLVRDVLRREEDRVKAIAALQREIDKGRASGTSDTSIDEVFAEARKKAIAALKARDAAA